MHELWSHQAAAWEASARSDVIVTTGTASGKSLAFNLPVLNELAADPRARALYLYPSKALAQDQARALAALRLPGLRPAIYDGDTPRESRAQIRRQANLILTNPDMLHMGILPNHEAWRPFLANLSAVVVDEAHAYRGVFGSHVANVLRRLRRLVGHDVRFLMASATIANPAELAERLTGLPDFALVDEDGSPGARKTVAMWNPPLTDEALGIRRSVLAEAADVVAELVREGARTICFMKSRRAVELLSRFVRDQLDPEEAARVAPYRAGYTPQQRREIERRLVEGELLAVISTDALELGIDIGELDAAVVVTFPGTVASLRQMWGRAGRRGKMGLAVYVAGEDALDQFFCRHPDEFFDRAVEAAILDHANEQIYAGHLVCAAHEAPLTPDDEAFFEDFAWHAERLVEAGELHRDRRGRYVPRHAERFPAADVSLRSASADAFAVVNVESGELIGTVEAARAFTTIHQGAVYLHMGVSYEVRELDLEGRVAMVVPFKGDWYTQPKKETMTEISRLLDRKTELGRDALLRARRGDGDGDRLPAQAHERRRADRPDRARPPDDLVHARRRSGTSSTTSRSPTTSCSARCTPPSTPRSRCSRCWRCATAGTSAACRRTCTRRRAGRPSSSTTAIPAGSASPAAASSCSRRSCATRTASSASASARTAAPPASSRPSAATSTSTCTRRAASRSWGRCWLT